MLVEALEDGRGVLGGHPRQQLAGLVGIELADEVRQVLGVDLVEQLAHLVRVLLEELLEVGAAASIVIAWAGNIASQSLQAMHRSSPFG